MRPRMRAIILVIILAACGGCALCRRIVHPIPDGGTVVRAVLPPVPAGCITDVTTGDHTFTCQGLAVDTRIPAKCQAPGCGLILLLHGDTGTGLLMDDHVRMRDLGEKHGYLVVAPTGPPLIGFAGSTWNQSNDATLVDIVNQFKSVFRADPKKIHVTGFSRGGFVTWRLLCDHADLFASAAPASAGYGNGFSPPETTCFQNGRAPARQIPILFLMGSPDPRVFHANMVAIRDGAITNYGATGPTVLDSDANYTHSRWTNSAGATIETFDHAYTTYPAPPATPGVAAFKAHCIVGSPIGTVPQYGFACVPPTAFVWGQQIMQFFIAHPMP